MYEFAPLMRRTHSSTSFGPQLWMSLGNRKYCTRLMFVRGPRLECGGRMTLLSSGTVSLTKLRYSANRRPSSRVPPLISAG